MVEADNKRGGGRGGGGAEPQNRGPLSRGLFSNDLLGLYDDAGSFQVQDYDKEDGYGNG